MGVSCFDGTGIEKPREKMKENGITSLSDAELLALILQVGNTKENVVTLSTRLLFEKGGLNGLFLGENQDLETFGVKEAKVTKLLAIREIIRRLPFSKSVRVHDTDGLVETLRPYFRSRQRETALVLFLSRDRTVLKRESFTQEDENKVLVPIGTVVRDSMLSGARFVIMIHNHPSGEVNPSNGDILFAEQLSSRLFLAGVTLLDFMIVTDESSYSLRSAQKGPFQPLPKGKIH